MKNDTNENHKDVATNCRDAYSAGFDYSTRMGGGAERGRTCKGSTEPDCKHDQLAVSEQHQLQCRARERDAEHPEYPASHPFPFGPRMESDHPHYYAGYLTTRL